MQYNIFERLVKLIGRDNFDKLTKSKVLIVGLGGVGGYVAESLCRSAIGKMIIIDFDTVDITNLNRQIIATHETIGQKKVDLFENRIKSINPLCIVEKHDLFLDQDTIKDIDLDNIDFIIDCCDSINTKKLLMKYSNINNCNFISCMGTANKMDPKKLEITKLQKTINDPIARILRKYAKEEHLKDIDVLSSIEVPKKNGNILASNSFVPASAGLLIASYVIKKLIK